MPNPVPAARIAEAKAAGLVNVEAIAVACRRARVPFHVAVALIEKESGGQNIYGHDAGGALSTNGRRVIVCGVSYPPGSNIPVTPANAAVFLLMIGAGARSNGMGPAQITYAGDLPDGRSGGFFRVMLENNLLPWDPVDNITFGLQTLRDHRDAEGSWEAAGARYNGSSDYGRDLASRIAVWRARFRTS